MSDSLKPSGSQFAQDVRTRYYAALDLAQFITADACSGRKVHKADEAKFKGMLAGLLIMLAPKLAQSAKTYVNIQRFESMRAVPSLNESFECFKDITRLMEDYKMFDLDVFPIGRVG